MSDFDRKRSSNDPRRRKKKRGKTTRYLLVGILVGFALVNLLNETNSDHDNEDSFLQDFTNTVTDISASASSMIYHTHQPTANEIINSSSGNPLSTSSRWTCSWFPAEHSSCDEMLTIRLQQTGNSQKGTEEVKRPQRQRWIFLGDSTMKRLFDRSALKHHLILEAHKKNKKKCLGRVTCKEHQQKDRCNMNSVYGLPYAEEWIVPDPNLFEGPVKYGSERGNEYCSDCSGCQTQFLECSFYSAARESINCGDHKRIYGGYMTMEFAKDREMQTPDYGYTQENIASYISQIWNTPELVRDWGKPICVLGDGNHDILLEGITRDDFLKNVLFLFNTFQPVCGHFICEWCFFLPVILLDIFSWITSHIYK